MGVSSQSRGEGPPWAPRVSPRRAGPAEEGRAAESALLMTTPSALLQGASPQAQPAQPRSPAAPLLRTRALSHECIGERHVDLPSRQEFQGIEKNYKNIYIFFLFWHIPYF